MCELARQRRIAWGCLTIMIMICSGVVSFMFLALLVAAALDRFDLVHDFGVMSIRALTLMVATIFFGVVFLPRRD